jgi:hypothetical protein
MLLKFVCERSIGCKIPIFSNISLHCPKHGLNQLLKGISSFQIMYKGINEESERQESGSERDL